MVWHEFHESCYSVTLIVLVISHQRWKQTRNRVCFHLWCELTLALWCHSIVWSFFHEIKCNGMTSFMEFVLCVVRKGESGREREPNSLGAIHTPFKLKPSCLYPLQPHCTYLKAVKASLAASMWRRELAHMSMTILYQGICQTSLLMEW